jgi:hypothetical protein
MTKISPKGVLGAFNSVHSLISITLQGKESVKFLTDQYHKTCLSFKKLQKRVLGHDKNLTLAINLILSYQFVDTFFKVFFFARLKKKFPMSKSS